MFCKHDWKILSETVTKSKWESSIDAAERRCAGNLTLPHQLCNADRKHIVVLTCEKCGKLKRFVEDI